MPSGILSLVKESEGWGPKQQRSRSLAYAPEIVDA